MQDAGIGESSVGDEAALTRIFRKFPFGRTVGAIRFIDFQFSRLDVGMGKGILCALYE